MPQPNFTAVQMIGTQRSGSNLLRLMLNQLDEVSAPHPPHILERFIPLLPAYGDLGLKANFIALATDVYRLIECNPVPWEEMTTDPEEIAARCRSNSIAEIFRVIYEIRAETQHARIWICKSMVNVQFADLLEQEIRPLYLHLFRDGRDVALSFMKAIVGEKHIYHIARQWRNEQEASLKLMEKLGSERVIQVRYETLLADPEAEVRRICRFIGTEYNSSAMDYFRSEESKHTAHSGEMWKNVEKPVLKDNFNKFEREMAPEDILLFEQVAGDTLVKLGYPLKFPNIVKKEFTDDEIAGFDSANEERKRQVRATISADDLLKRKGQEDLLKSIRGRMTK